MSSLFFEVEGPSEWFPKQFFETLKSFWPDLETAEIQSKHSHLVRYRFYDVTTKQAYLIGQQHAKYIIKNAAAEKEVQP